MAGQKGNQGAQTPRKQDQSGGGKKQDQGKRSNG